MGDLATIFPAGRSLAMDTETNHSQMKPIRHRDFHIEYSIYYVLRVKWVNKNSFECRKRFMMS